MAVWCDGVRSAQFLIEYVERALQDNGISFREVMLHPYKTNGGRSEGVTACFDWAIGEQLYVSVYEHWNSDHICVKFDDYKPMNMVKGHDVPTIMFKDDEVNNVIAAIQLYLENRFGFKIEKIYILLGFTGIYQADIDFVQDVQKVLMPHLPNLEE